MSTYHKRDVDYYILQNQSMQALLVAVKDLLDTHNNQFDKSEINTVLRVEGGILREESIGTYAQVLVETEYTEIAECL